MRPVRANNSSSTTRISSRARFAPRQWCMPWPNPRCGLGSRATSKRKGSANTVSSRFADASQNTTLSPGAIMRPPSSISRVAVRRLYAAGCVQRTISSTAVGMRLRSSRRRASSSGKSVSATTAPAIALRVVSAPAAHSSEKKNWISASVSCGGSSPSSVAWQTIESMSSAGSARFDATSRVPYSNIAAAADATSSVVSKASRSLKSNTCSIQVNNWWRSASGMPMRMQIACIGNSPAISGTKSISPFASAVSISRPARPRSSSSSRAIVRGVSPLLTRSRTRWCRGSSIMLSI